MWDSVVVGVSSSKPERHRMNRRSYSWTVLFRRKRKEALVAHWCDASYSTSVGQTERWGTPSLWLRLGGSFFLSSPPYSEPGRPDFLLNPRDELSVRPGVFDLPVGSVKGDLFLFPPDDLSQWDFEFKFQVSNVSFS